MTVQAMDRAEINGVALEVRARGSGEPVVFVHGAMGDECAAILTEPLLANHYRLIDYHRRGWGNSEQLHAPLSIEQQAADCRAVMHHFGVERAHLVGQSYGGIILLQMAFARRPPCKRFRCWNPPCLRSSSIRQRLVR